MERLLNRLADLMLGASSVVLVIMMAITFIDVVGRYAFSAPLPFAVEVIEPMMGLAIALGLAATTLARGHISVDLVTAAAPKSVGAILARLAAAFGAVFIGLMAWRLYDKAVGFMGQGLQTGDVLGFPLWPIVAVMAVATGVAALAALWLIFTPAAEKKTEHFALED